MPSYYNSTAAKPMNTRRDLYQTGGRVALKEGANGKWIQKVTKSIKAAKRKGS